MVDFKEQVKYKITKYLTRLDKAILIDNYNSTLKYSLHLKYNIQKGGVDKYDFTTLDSIITILQEPQYDLENKIKQVELQKNIIEKKIIALENEIIALDSEKATLNSEKATLESDKKKLESVINNKINDLKQQDFKIKSLQDEIKTNKELELKNKKALTAKDNALEKYKNQIISLTNDIDILVQQKESLKKNTKNITKTFPGLITDKSNTKVKITEYYEKMKKDLIELINKY